MGGVDVQPHLVTPADFGDVGQRIECSDRRGTSAGRDRDDRHVRERKSARIVVELLDVHASRGVDRYADT